MEYKILREYGIYGLQYLVNEHLKKWLQASWGLITDANISSHAYIQVVVK